MFYSLAGLGDSSTLTYPIETAPGTGMWIVVDPATCPTPKVPTTACPTGFTYQLTKIASIGINPSNQTTYSCPSYTCQNSGGLSPYDSTAASCPAYTPTQEALGAATIAAVILLPGGWKLLGLLGAVAIVIDSLGEEMGPAYDAGGNLIPGKCAPHAISW